MEIKSQDEILAFLYEVNKLINASDKNMIIIKKRLAKRDKTKEYMDEHGLKHKDVVNEILKLKLSDYSYTDIDKSESHDGEFWFFGIIPSCIPNCRYEVYVKLKLKSRVICMSFHEAERPMSHPYF